jgi:hypothetical protein
LLAVSTHELPQSVGVLDEQPEAHEYAPASPAGREHTGAPASALHALPHAPQFDALE